VPEPVDLFESLNAPDQLSLFDDDEGRPPAPPPQSYRPTPEEVRRRLNVVLDRARAAPATPWPERDARLWRTVFPQMADWLPDDEANQLRFEFAREVERLAAA
jgi:hypothetical protein